jgi:hypothetical protein
MVTRIVGASRSEAFSGLWPMGAGRTAMLCKPFGTAHRLATVGCVFITGVLDERKDSTPCSFIVVSLAKFVQIAGVLYFGVSRLMYKCDKKPYKPYPASFSHKCNAGDR